MSTDGSPSEFEPDDRADIVRELGRLMRRLHEHGTPPGLPADWDGFLRERLERAEEHHAVGRDSRACS